MKTLFSISLLAAGLLVGCASQDATDGEQPKDVVREHQTPEDRAAHQQEVQIDRQLNRNPEPWR